MVPRRSSSFVDLAQDVLTEQFASGSISAFMHINDGVGEGGSDLWFLAMPGATGGQMDQGGQLVSEVAAVCAVVQSL